MKELGVDITIFLAPYHPYVYKHMVELGDKKIVSDVEHYLRTMAKNNNLTVKGSYDPSRSDCVEEEFYDGMHPKESCVNRIFQENYYD